MQARVFAVASGKDGVALVHALGADIASIWTVSTPFRCWVRPIP
jgi:hypothetical protein